MPVVAPVKPPTTYSGKVGILIGRVLDDSQLVAAILVHASHSHADSSVVNVVVVDLNGEEPAAPFNNRYRLALPAGACASETTVSAYTAMSCVGLQVETTVTARGLTAAARLSAPTHSFATAAVATATGCSAHPAVASIRLGELSFLRAVQ